MKVSLISEWRVWLKLKEGDKVSERIPSGSDVKDDEKEN
jgi:hypothetical protein